MTQNPSGKSSKLYKSRLQNDPSFERIRENAAEFSVAGKAAKLIRNAFRSQIKSTDPGRSLVGRMQKQLMKILKTDTTSNRGERLVSKGDLSIFKEFEFNEKALLGATFSVNISPTVDRTTGRLAVQLPVFIPVEALTAPMGSTHFRIVVAAAELDIEKGEHISNVAQTEFLPLQKEEVTIPNLENQITANSQKALLQVICIEFHQEVNGKMYLLKEDRHNPMKVIHAESAVV